MAAKEITLKQSSDGGFYTKLLRGRYVTSIDNDVITLDNGTELRVWGNDGCMSCGNGSYWLEQVFKQGSSKARIMSAYVDCDEDDGNPSTVYTIFVMVDGNPHHLPLATVRGDDGNGYYGTGFTLTATIETPSASPVTVTPRDIIKAVAGEKTPPSIPNIPDRETLLNAVAYTIRQTRGFDSPLRITGPEARLFHKLTMSQYGGQYGPYYALDYWSDFSQATLLWFVDMEDGVSFVLRDLSNGVEAYAAKLLAFTERVCASEKPVKAFVTSYALKGGTATVNGIRVHATDFLLSEVCGFHGRLFNNGYNGKYINQHYFLHYEAMSYGVRIVKHREGGRGDVAITSKTQNVWAVNPQEVIR